jgi:hypothetical protein
LLKISKKQKGPTRTNFIVFFVYIFVAEFETKNRDNEKSKKNLSNLPVGPIYRILYRSGVVFLGHNLSQPVALAPQSRIGNIILNKRWMPKNL